MTSRAAASAWHALGVWLLLLGGLLALRAGLDLAAGFDLHFDEAQYWLWSQQLEWSYYSKGPLVAWLMALSTGLWGDVEWAVRLPGWMAHGLWLWLLFRLTAELADLASARWAVALGVTTPLFLGLGQVATTDGPLLCCWTWGLWAFYRAIFQGRRRAWWAAGVAVGVGALAKLSILLLPAAVGLWLLSQRRGRRLLARAAPWEGLLAALLGALPLIYWNLQNDWLLLQHERGHLGGVDLEIRRFGEFLLGQMGLLLPLTVALLGYGYRQRTAAPAGVRWCAQLGLWLLLFFIAKALLDKVQANWPAPAYIALFPLAGWAAAQALRRRGLYATMTLSLVLVAIAYFPHRLGLSQTPFHALYGWRQGALALAAQMPDAQFILTTRYPYVGELAFYWPRPIPVYLVGSERRFTHYDLWPGPAQEAGRRGLFVATTPAPPPELGRAFERCRPLTLVVPRSPGGAPLRGFWGFACDDYRAINWPAPQRR